MSQHRFILKFDSTAGEWSHDVESELLRFDGKTIYHPKEDRWVAPNTNSDEVLVYASSIIDKTSTLLMSQLVTLLNTMYANAGKDK